MKRKICSPLIINYKNFHRFSVNEKPSSFSFSFSLSNEETSLRWTWKIIFILVSRRNFLVKFFLSINIHLLMSMSRCLLVLSLILVLSHQNLAKKFSILFSSNENFKRIPINFDLCQFDFQFCRNDEFCLESKFQEILFRFSLNEIFSLLIFLLCRSRFSWLRKENSIDEKWFSIEKIFSQKKKFTIVHNGLRWISTNFTQSFTSFTANSHKKTFIRKFSRRINFRWNNFFCFSWWNFNETFSFQEQVENLIRQIPSEPTEKSFLTSMNKEKLRKKMLNIDPLIFLIKSWFFW